ncbi:MAG: hypothetical protein EOO68_02550 [Moraxellaceae bacterium]|nr:MAG: hypothetical protein EOO68_02550 [Moraxellaceae bacterium]
MRMSTCFKSIVLFNFLACSSAFAHQQEHPAKNCDERLAPKTLNGYTINYQILESKTTLSEFPYKGVVVSDYQHKRFTAQGTGTLTNNSSPAKEYSEGSYRYDIVDCDTAIETAVLNLPQPSRRTTQLIFASRNSGTWEQVIDNGRVVLAGKFSLVKSNAANTAPNTKTDFHYALIIKSTQSDLPPDNYPRAGLVVQTYLKDGTMTFTGIGPGTINSTGTYTYKKVSPNTGVEEAVQTSAFFSLPYTMVYTFDTTSSGTWEQNFANGLIKFSGTFDSFPSQ